MNKRFLARSFWVFDSELEFFEIKRLDSPEEAKKIANVLNEVYNRNFDENDVLTKLIELKLVRLNMN